MVDKSTALGALNGEKVMNPSKGPPQTVADQGVSRMYARQEVALSIDIPCNALQTIIWRSNIVNSNEYLSHVGTNF